MLVPRCMLPRELDPGGGPRPGSCEGRPLPTPASRDEGAGAMAALWLAVPHRWVSSAFGGLGFIIVQASTLQLGLPWEM